MKNFTYIPELWFIELGCGMRQSTPHIDPYKR